MHERQMRYERTGRDDEHRLTRGRGRRDVLRAAGGLAAVGLGLGVGSASAQEEATIVVDLAEDAIDVDGETAATLTLSAVPDGLAGFSVTVAVDPEVATVGDVEFPEAFGMTETEDESDESVTLRAVDVEKNVEAGDTDVELGTVDLAGVADGETSVEVEVVRIDADGGEAVDPDVEAATLTVGDPGDPGGEDAEDSASAGNALTPAARPASAEARTSPVR